jgi:NitT/TauT family transport system permease protein
MTRVGWYRLFVVAGAIALLEVLCLTGVIDKITMQPRSYRDLACSSRAGQRRDREDAHEYPAGAGPVLGAGVIAGALLHRIPLRDTLDPLFATYAAHFRATFFIVSSPDLPQS